MTPDHVGATIAKLCRWTLVIVLLLAPVQILARPSPQQVNDLDGLWNFYKYRFIDAGRIVSHDEGGITTSEGQGYAMLRAVWGGDRETFRAVWEWTRDNLARDDGLFSWKWQGRILDPNAATDADTDIALALLLAARRFDDPSYEHQALRILKGIWEQEVLEHGGKRYLTGGNWAPHEAYPTIHVGYLAPYAYEVFAEADPSRPWRELVHSSYEILEWLFVDQALPLPPEKVYLDRNTGRLLLGRPGQSDRGRFSYDVFPIYWRVATDIVWFDRDVSTLQDAMLAFFRLEWQRRQKFLDHYQLSGRPASDFEGLPLYATVAALARTTDGELALAIERGKLEPLRQAALGGADTPYYLHNWLAFDLALQVLRARHYDEFLSFLYPFDAEGFLKQFPLFGLTVFLALAFASRYQGFRYHGLVKATMLLLGFVLCARYLVWRMGHSLNYVEPVGPYISIALLAAEFYCFSTVLLLLLQVGLAPARQARPETRPGFEPSVDVFIPIFSESLEILENTLIAAEAMHYRNKTIYVCDDSHRESVRELAERLGAVYVRGPREHAKAGNINNALTRSNGELVLIFDTDHIPVRTFLDETVAMFLDPELGFVQTAHHFYNKDIFQRALNTGIAVPNEQDMFHHGIQAGRDAWGGAFFVGTGALFRRRALEEIGGLLLMSITEDIHTSQHLHARGWRSRFVGKNLAVGLNAENFAGYLVQRTRWMQGCLQVFFKDNPLLTGGLSWRHRLGYFASQYYFFFPAARIVFLAAPLCFLLFHWHPIFSDVSTLLAYLLPFMLCLPIVSQSLLPGWPRLLWATAYENTVAVSLFRGMFDLVLPRRLAFKVTPKGVAADRSAFDYRSARYSLLAAVITLLAIIKGLWEFYFFGIERDAYFFNLAWAGINLLVLITPLVIAYEKPSYRHQERIRKSMPVVLSGDGFRFVGMTHDVDLDGLSVELERAPALPSRVEVLLGDDPSLRLAALVSFHDRDERGKTRLGVQFDEPDFEQRRWLLLQVYCDPATWAGTVTRRCRSNLVMCYHYLRGLLSVFRHSFDLRRLQPRSACARLARVTQSGQDCWMLVIDRGRGGLGACAFGRGPGSSQAPVAVAGEAGSFRMVYRQRLLPGLWRVGLVAGAGASNQVEDLD